MPPRGFSMPRYFEEHSNRNAPRLPPRHEEVNELLLASYHLATYGGCEFGCPYCDAWSFDECPLNENIRAFVDLPERLATELPRIDSGDVIGLTRGDPYQPAEQVYRVTRKVLKVLMDHKHPCLVLTKSPSVLEDLALLQTLNQRSFAIVVMTVVTIDDSLSHLLESQVPTPAERVNTRATLQRAGIPCGFALIPIIPFLTDDEEHLSRTLETLATAQPDFVLWDYLWLPNEGHRMRMVDLLQDHDRCTLAEYEKLYGDSPQPDISYRRTIDRLMIKHCLRLGLEPRIPPQLYADRLSGGNGLRTDVEAGIIPRKSQILNVIKKVAEDSRS